VPDLSVIVPAYNAEPFLPTCLATIRANAADGIRFLVVDDHSSDETPRILEDAARTMPYLTVIRNARNEGVARSRNIAHREVDTRYLTYLDVDDWYAPGHLTRLAAAIEHLGVDFVRTDHVRVEGESRTVVRAPEERLWEPYAAAEGIGSAGVKSMVDYPFLWAGIYDVSRIDPALFSFDETLRTAADRPWFWRLHLGTATTARADLLGYFYRKTTSSTALTQAGNAHTLHFLPASERIADLLDGVDDPVLVGKAAYQAVRIVEFHVSRRERLSPELQKRLFAGSHHLLARYPADAVEVAIAEFDRPERVLLRRIAGMGA